jgi:glutaredoxin-related protein
MTFMKICLMKKNNDAFDKIESAIKSSPVVMFIKGPQENPKDENSREVVLYLETLKI